MAIDTKSISQLIKEFRKLSAKDAITPESLGYILQRLADLLATAGTAELQTVIGNWYNALNNAEHIAIAKLQQGPGDRNFVRLQNTFVDLMTGQKSVNDNATIINMATTERAGAMKAQQVVDLNAARRNVAELQTQMAAVEKLIDQIKIVLGLGNTKGVIVNAQVSCIVEDGVLHILGAQNLIANGYVPYLFRRIRKRNQFKDKTASEEERAKKKYCAEKKGWCLMGSIHTVKIVGTTVQFTTNGHSHLSMAANGYSIDPENLVKPGVDDRGNPCFGWGRTSVKLLDHKITKTKKRRMIRLKYAIGFASPIKPGRSTISPANLASSLAEFHVVYNPSQQTWHFSR